MHLCTQELHRARSGGGEGRGCLCVYSRFSHPTTREGLASWLCTDCSSHALCVCVYSTRHTHTHTHTRTHADYAHTHTHTHTHTHPHTHTFAVIKPRCLPFLAARCSRSRFLRRLRSGLTRPLLKEREFGARPKTS